MKSEIKQLTMKEALRVEANGNAAILNELTYSSYKANRNYGMSHEQAVSIGLGNTDSLIRYNKESNDPDFWLNSK